MSVSAFASENGAPSTATWRLLSSEAHRLMFFFGALQSVIAVAWYCYLGVIASAFLRGTAEYAPPAVLGTLMIAAAAVWLVSLGAWAWRYVPMYLTPRMDAR